MAESLLLALGVTSSFLGMGWLALSLNPHWHQVRLADGPPVRRLRIMAAAALVTSLLLCLWADHRTIAVLVWMMVVSGSALSVAMLLAWRPRWLKPLVAWVS